MSVSAHLCASAGPLASIVSTLPLLAFSVSFDAISLCLSFPAANCFSKAVWTLNLYVPTALGLGRQPELLERFRESELIHSRWAMAGILTVAWAACWGFARTESFLGPAPCRAHWQQTGRQARYCRAGVAGVLGVELAGQGNWFDAPNWVSPAGLISLLNTVLQQCVFALQS